MDKDSKLIPTSQEVAASKMDDLCRNSIDLIQYARKMAAKQVNLVQLMTFYSLGRWIVEEQQQGESRAKYGQQVITKLSEALNAKFGKGFSEDTLKNARKFYLTYKDRISETVFSLFAIEKSETVFSLFKKEVPFTLPWSHYLLLMRIKNENERNFYEIEATQGRGAFVFFNASIVPVCTSGWHSVGTKRKS